MYIMFSRRYFKCPAEKKSSLNMSETYELIKLMRTGTTTPMSYECPLNIKDRGQWITRQNNLGGTMSTLII